MDPGNKCRDDRRIRVESFYLERRASNRFEAERIEWVPVDQLRELIRTGEVHDGLSLTALSTALAMGEIA